MGRQVLSPTASNESPMTFAVFRQVGSRPARASGSGFKLDRELDLVFHDPELCFSGLLDAAPLRERFPGLDVQVLVFETQAHRFYLWRLPAV